MNTLLIADPLDLHFRAIFSALTSLGHSVEFFSTTAFPSRDTFNVDFSGTSPEIDYKIDGCSHSDLDADVVLYHRMSPLHLGDAIDNRDRALAESESRKFLSNLLQIMCPAAAWINPYSASSIAASRLLHLRVASRLGLSLPRILATSEIGRLGEFILANRDGVERRSIIWQDSNHQDINNYGTPPPFPAKVDHDDLSDKTNPRPIPYLYQSLQLGSRRVELICMDGLTTAVEIIYRDVISRDAFSSKDDVPIYSVKQIEVPPNVLVHCARLLETLSLRLSVLEFEVLGSSWVFLGIRPSNRFLWVEALNPDIRLLGALCQFLTECNGERDVSTDCDKVRLADHVAY